MTAVRPDAGLNVVTERVNLKTADELADVDATEVLTAAGYRVRRMAPTDIVCLVDGSAYSPSWRALDGGAEVWAMDHDDACERYEESFDAIIADWNGRQEECLVWDDGCLFLMGADADFEEVLS